jgi:eukaryotic-like serine/threonine-protein kinase
MIRRDDASAAEQFELEAMLAFDQALAGGTDPNTSTAHLFLHPVHECQRLLEAVWPRSVSTAFELPREFGRFSIVRELGRGGFGVVFLAVDRVLGRQVALKVPRPEVLVTPEVKRRFLREAEAASRFDHPNIVPVFEVGEEGPICYIASAYCEGPTLAQWLREQTAPVPIRLASRLVAIVAAAVAHAHERGILHRDLKPGNILLQQRSGNTSESDELGFVPRICDFGLAKLLDQVSQETRSGMPIGSPDYMAPEQAAGRLRDHGPATDVYALGVVLYEVLTGRPPQRGESDLETLRLISDQDPPSPRALRPGLARDLDTIVLKCLEKQPARRYSSAAELAEDLQYFLDGSPVKARPARPWERAGKWARRRPAHAALLAAVGALGLVVVGGLGWARAREKKQNDSLVVALEAARRSAADARQQRAFGDRQGLLAHSHLSATQLKAAASLIELEDYDGAQALLDTLRPPQSLTDTRDFAWYYLHRLVSPRVQKLPPLPERVRTVASSRDGRTMALSDDGRNTFLLNCDTGAMRSLPGKPNRLGGNRMVFSPDGRTLASLSNGAADPYKCEVTLWDVESGVELEGMASDLGYTYQIMFSPDSGTLITVEAGILNRQATVRSWQLSSDGKRVSLVETLRGDELTVKLSPANRTIYSARGPFRFSDCLAVTPDPGSTTAVWLETGEIRLYSTSSGSWRATCRIVGPEVVFVPRIDASKNACSPEEVREIGRVACVVSGRAHARPISSEVPIHVVAFSPDGRDAAVCQRYKDDRRGTVRIIDVATGQAHPSSTWGNVAEECNFGFTPRGDALVIAGFDASARILDYRAPRAPTKLSGHAKEVWGLAFSPDSQTLVSSSDDGTLRMWDVASGQEQQTLSGHKWLVTAVAYSPNGLVLASAGFDNKIRLWDAAGGAEIATLPGHRDHVRSLAFSPDGSVIASAGYDREIRLWDVARRREIQAPLTGHVDPVYAVTFAPDGKTLFSGSLDKTIKLWDWKRGQLRATWYADDQVYALACSPDGQTLAMGQHRGMVSLWDIEQGKARAPMRGHVGDVLGVTFSHDGRTLASAGRDNTVRLWDPVTGHEMLTLKGHEAPVHGLAFSPDGTILATGSYDGAIKLWRASPRMQDHETTGNGPSVVTSN